MKLTPEQNKLYNLVDKTAKKEGWVISFRDDRNEFELQRIDEKAKFKSDNEAHIHVLNCAFNGSKIHQSALYFLAEVR